jgi:hypothetical protein
VSKLFWWEAGNWLIVVINFWNMSSDMLERNLETEHVLSKPKTIYLQKGLWQINQSVHQSYPGHFLMTEDAYIWYSPYEALKVGSTSILTWLLLTVRTYRLKSNVVDRDIARLFIIS